MNTMPLTIQFALIIGVCNLIQTKASQANYGPINPSPSYTPYSTSYATPADSVTNPAAPKEYATGTVTSYTANNHPVPFHKTANVPLHLDPKDPGVFKNLLNSSPDPAAVIASGHRIPLFCYPPYTISTPYSFNVPFVTVKTTASVNPKFIESVPGVHTLSAFSTYYPAKSLATYYTEPGITKSFIPPLPYFSAFLPSTALSATPSISKTIFPPYHASSLPVVVKSATRPGIVPRDPHFLHSYLGPSFDS